MRTITIAIISSIGVAAMVLFFILYIVTKPIDISAGHPLVILNNGMHATNVVVVVHLADGTSLAIYRGTLPHGETAIELPDTPKQDAVTGALSFIVIRQHRACSCST